jgi:hypothetical protein
MVDRRKRWTRKSDTIWNVMSLLTAIHRLERNDPSKQYGSKSAWVLLRVNPSDRIPASRIRLCLALRALGRRGAGLTVGTDLCPANTSAE